MERAGFFDPEPTDLAARRILVGLAAVGSPAPQLGELARRLSTGAPLERALFLDAAASLAELADHRWRLGQPIAALLVEGVESRVLEQVIAPKDG